MSLFFINLDIESDNRYDLSKFMRYTDNYDPLTSDLLKNLKDIPSAGNHVVSYDEQRPDKTSRILYGDFSYWWLILFYNDLTAVEQLKRGMVIQYPRREDLENYYFSLNQRQLRTES